MSVDPGTIILAAGTYQLTKESVQRILGPTFDHYGQELQSWVDRREENVARIFSKAEGKMGPNPDPDEAVAPRVLKGVLNEGAFCEDEVMAEYFGGVLASSKTHEGRDDRGTVYTSLLSRLSTYHIRAHYILYEGLRQELSGDDYDFARGDERKRVRIYLPLNAFVPSMDLTDSEINHLPNISSHICYGLHKEEIVGDTYGWGSVDNIGQLLRRFDVEEDELEPGFIFCPTPVGIGLLLWAYGRSEVLVNNFLDQDLELPEIEGIQLPEEIRVFTR